MPPILRQLLPGRLEGRDRALPGTWPSRPGGDSGVSPLWVGPSATSVPGVSFDRDPKCSSSMQGTMAFCDESRLLMA